MTPTREGGRPPSRMVVYDGGMIAMAQRKATGKQQIGAGVGKVRIGSGGGAGRTGNGHSVGKERIGAGGTGIVERKAPARPAGGLYSGGTKKAGAPAYTGRKVENVKTIEAPNKAVMVQRITEKRIPHKVK